MREAPCVQTSAMRELTSAPLSPSISTVVSLPSANLAPGTIRSPERFFESGSGRRNSAPPARRVRALLALLFSTLAVWVSAQGVPEVEIRALIEQLGARSHKEREKAAAALWQIGDPALELLKRAAKADDPEVSDRAGALIDNIRLGILPSWPESLREQVGNFEGTPLEKHPEFMSSLAKARGAEAVPFLLSRLHIEGNPDGETAVKLLQGLAEDPAARDNIRKRIGPPANQNEARLLAHLLKGGGSFSDQLALLELKHLPPSDRRPVIDALLKSLREKLTSADPAGVEQDAEAAAKACPEEAGFLYLQGLAAAGRTGELTRANELFRQALALHPDDEAPHYSAGTLLNDLGHPELSEREWRRILEIPPVDEVYDINAHLRLGDILKRRHENKAAADAFERALVLYREKKEKGGSGFGLMGDEKELEAMIARLRSAIESEWKLSLQSQVKEGRREAMNNMLKAADVTLSLNVQPAGFRLFEVAPATVSFDTERKQYIVLLNGSPCGEGVAGELKKGGNKVAVRTLDMVYLFDVAGDTGKAQKLESYEKDYIIRIRPSEEVRSWKHLVIRVNGKEQTLAELEDGLFFDWLPEKLLLEAAGVTPDGQRREFKNEIPIRDTP